MMSINAAMSRDGVGVSVMLSLRAIVAQEA
jgi:hypothetical protein